MLRAALSSRSRYRDGFGLPVFGFWEGDRQDPVFEFGFDPVGVDFFTDRDCALERDTGLCLSFLYFGSPLMVSTAFSSWMKHPSVESPGELGGHIQRIIVVVNGIHPQRSGCRAQTCVPPETVANLIGLR